MGASWLGHGGGPSGGGGESNQSMTPGKATNGERSDNGKEEPSALQDKLYDLALKQRMNTGIRRSIFCAIMSSTDYEDAFDKLMSLNLT